MIKHFASLLRRIVGRIKMYMSLFYMMIAALAFPASLFAAVELKPDKSLAFTVLAIGIIAMLFAIQTIKKEQRDDTQQKINAFYNTETRFLELKELLAQVNKGIDDLVNEIRQDRNERNNKSG